MSYHIPTQALLQSNTPAEASGYKNGRRYGFHRHFCMDIQWHWKFIASDLRTSLSNRWRNCPRRKRASVVNCTVRAARCLIMPSSIAMNRSSMSSLVSFKSGNRSILCTMTEIFPLQKFQKKAMPQNWIQKISAKFTHHCLRYQTEMWKCNIHEVEQ